MLPTVVIGGGVAGMCTALALAPRPVVLVLRGVPGEDGATPLAQGGIAAAVGPGDSAFAHAEDTLRAGAHHNRRAAVNVLAVSALPAIHWLQAQGLAFDREGQAWALAREGGHGRARVLHAGGDATGAVLARTLARAVKAAAHIEVWSGHGAEALLQAPNGDVRGVVLRAASGASLRLPAQAVVLATGGIGGLFAASTGPDNNDGSGLALAMAVGAPLRDLEYIQFHPTALAPATGAACGRLGLITEALRGAGARLRDREGRYLMSGKHPLGDLAPRDVVARAVAGAGRAWLDATACAIDWPRAFPTVFGLLQARGIDPNRDWIPVLPAAHFHMGGIATDLEGRSGVPGLFAVGEVACTGVHGANRLASNSLLEGVVFGLRTAAAVRATPAAAGRLRVAAAGPAMRGAALSALRHSVSAALGPERDPASMQHALAQLADADSRQARVARALLRAALANTQQLGAHWPVQGEVRAA